MEDRSLVIKRVLANLRRVSIHITIMDSPSSSPLRIYFIPFLTPSHMVPLFELSRLFLSRGHHVTILTTPSNVLSLQKSSVSGHHPPNSDHLRFHAVEFPSEEVGLPAGVENLFQATDFDSLLKFFKAFPILQKHMELFMESDPPDCIVSDAFFPWTAEFAARLRVPRLVFDVYCIFAASLMESVRGPDSPHIKARSESDPFLIPGLPHPITMTRFQLPDYVKKPDGNAMLVEKFREAELKSYGRVVNSFVELEEEYKEHYEKIMGNKIYHLGPFCLVNKTSEEKFERGVKSKVNEHECLSWLNSKPPNSVVYICFGSSCFFSDKQLYEIATGIESSGHSFIWVVFRKDGVDGEDGEDEKWLPIGFRERMEKREKRGMIIKGWAPQVLILEHEAVGGFMSHCGWSSVTEGICAGVPMLTWPLTAEQFYNEKLVTQVHGIGVEVGSEEWTVTAGHERKKVVGRDRIEEAVKKVMDGGDEAENMRKRVKELEKKAKAAMEENGSSQKNLTLLIEDLDRIRAQRKVTSTTLI